MPKPWLNTEKSWQFRWVCIILIDRLKCTDYQFFSVPCTSWPAFYSFPYPSGMQLILMHFLSNNFFTSPVIGLWLLLIDRQVYSCGFSFEAILSFLFDFLLFWLDSLLEHPVKRTLITLFSAASWKMVKRPQRSYPFFVSTMPVEALEVLISASR